MDIKENTDELFSKLENFFKTETVVGKPIRIDNIVLVPFITVTFGCGTGMGEGPDSSKKQALAGGGGLGAGARITPDAVLVIKGDSVQLIPIRDKDNFDKLLNLVPGIVKKVDKSIKNHKAKKAEDKKNENIAGQ